MKMSFICEDCKKEYSRETYTSRDSKHIKEFWREKKGTEYGLCYDCYKKLKEEEKAKASAEAAEKAAKEGLPKLEGTEKQVAWAETIRQELFSCFEKIGEENTYGIRKNKILYDRFIETVRNETRAKWFIDNRDSFHFIFITSFIEFMEEYLTAVTPRLISEKEENDPQAVDAKAEATIMPEKAIASVAAEIKVSDDKIIAIFEKNDTFIQVAKSLQYKWSGSAWERKINKFNGPAEDRAAELGNKLLNAGFPICIMDADIRKAAVDGTYNPEQTNWIAHRVTGEYKGWLTIGWEGKNDKLYRSARSLPGSRWSSPCVVVRVEHYKEVQEFAELYGFKFSSGALEAIEAHKKAQAKIETVTPAKVEEPEQKDGLKEILNSGSDIIDDLKD